MICTFNTTNCTLYDLVADPLEEYPLGKPGNCANYNTVYDMTDPEWHYCRLIEVVATYSIF